MLSALKTRRDWDWLSITPMLGAMTTVARARGEYRKTAQRREQILDAAFSVFAQTGFLNATLAEIAKRANITAPGLAHHFRSKSALLEAVFERRDLDANDRLAGKEGLDLLRGLVSITERDEVDLDLTRMFAIISAEATDLDHPMHDYFRKRYDLVHRHVLAGLTQVEDAGLLRPGFTPAEAARTYIALSDGLQLQALYAGKTVSQSTLARKVLSSLLTVEL
jgi:AcrR family transcriptional regulator